MVGGYSPNDPEQRSGRLGSSFLPIYRICFRLDHNASCLPQTDTDPHRAVSDFVRPSSRHLGTGSGVYAEDRTSSSVLAPSEGVIQEHRCRRVGGNSPY